MDNSSFAQLRLIGLTRAAKALDVAAVKVEQLLVEAQAVSVICNVSKSSLSFLH